MEQTEEVNFTNYVIIPTEVITDKDLTLGAKLLYGIVNTLSKKEGYCFAGNPYLAKLLGVSADTISRWFSELIKAGYLNAIYKKDVKRGSTLRYATLNVSFKKDPDGKNAEGGLGKNAVTGLGKNAEYNNINLNNMSNKSDDLLLAKQKTEKKETGSQRVITDKYCEVYQSIYGKKFEPVAKDYWSRTSHFIKSQLNRFTVEQLCSAIDMAKNEKWLKDRGFDLQLILSNNMVERLLNPACQKSGNNQRADSYDWDNDWK